MKNFQNTVLFLGGVLCGLYVSNDNTDNVKISDHDTISVNFTPGGRCRPLIIKEINNAQKEILMQAYSFTAYEICYSLIQAHKKGVVVRIILDKSQFNSKVHRILAQSGIKVYFDYKVNIAHNKVIIIDDLSVITGSYNFSEAAETYNAENLLIIKNAEIIKKYKKNWENRLAVSTDDYKMRYFIQYKQKNKKNFG